MALSSGLKNILKGTLTSPTVASGVDKSIANYEKRLGAIGQETPKPEKNFLVGLLENLSRTGYGASNMLQEITSPYAGFTPGKFDPLAAFWRGLSLKERTTGQDVMRSIGLDDTTGLFGGQPKWYNPSLAGLTGFALDVVNPLDPLNWLGFGSGEAVIGGAKGTEALAKAFGSKAADIAATLGDDIVQGLGSPTVGKLISQIGKQGADLVQRPR